ncbi:MAG TPA: aspartate carbamoyltransferase catalytic subunit [Atribacteraceae bacterium]|nr:aspartate carbamoyltransferase catalytic subunit [Atribacteraceae bacterium]
MNWAHRHLLGIGHLRREDIFFLLERAGQYRDSLDESPKQKPILAGYSMVNFFLEASTRTRLSFEMAGRLLGMDVLSFSGNASSLEKGESFRDTVRTLSRMKFDVLVVRHQSSGIPEYLSDFLPQHIVNAGDGLREHPTQALLDLLTIQRAFGDFSGITVVIIGDLLHSRVARSLIKGLTMLDCSVLVSGPPTLVPQVVESMGARVVFPVEEALRKADVVYLLRVQKERQEAGYFPSNREYEYFFGLNARHWDMVSERAYIMHPGPVNRGVEIASELVECSRSLIEEQITCGLAVRMAVLETLIRQGR